MGDAVVNSKRTPDVDDCKKGDFSAATLPAILLKLATMGRDGSQNLCWMTVVFAFVSGFGDFFVSPKRKKTYQQSDDVQMMQYFQTSE